MKKIILSIAVCIPLIFIGIALSAESVPNEDAIITSILKGGDLYQTSCSVCHGDKGNADTWVSKSLNPVPRNFTEPEVIAMLTRERMFHSIYNGRPNTAMQPFRHQLTDMQIISIIDYIRSKMMRLDVFKERQKVPKPSKAAQEDSKAAGAALSKDGKSLYQTSCSVCHGDDGNAATWASNALNPKPRNFTDPEVIAMLTRERMILSVSDGLPGTAMQPFRHQLSEVQIVGIVDYIRSNLMKVDVKTGKKKARSR